MKIVDRKTFLGMPDGTVFSKYAPQYFEGLCIKRETVGGCDFRYDQLADALPARDTAHHMELCYRAEAGESVPLDFERSYRDGLFEDEQLFSVWERADVEALIVQLQQSLLREF